MNALPSARAVGILILAVGIASAGFASAASQPTSDAITDMVATIFATIPPSDHMMVVFKDDHRRVYLAFYLATYADIQELRAYSISFRNMQEVIGDLDAIDDLLAAGDQSAAFDLLVSEMRLDLGSKYVSDVELDGIHDGDVAVGAGSLRDRFHNLVFRDYEEAESAYLQWLERAVELSILLPTLA